MQNQFMMFRQIQGHKRDSNKMKTYTKLCGKMHTITCACAISTEPTILRVLLNEQFSTNFSTSPHLCSLFTMLKKWPVFISHMLWLEVHRSYDLFNCYNKIVSRYFSNFLQKLRYNHLPTHTPNLTNTTK